MQQRNQAFARVVMPGLRSSCYSRAASPWSTRDMPNVHNLYPIIENAVKNFEGILDERHHVEAGPLFDLGRAERVSADAIDDGPDAGYEERPLPGRRMRGGCRRKSCEDWRRRGWSTQPSCAPECAKRGLELPLRSLSRCARPHRSPQAPPAWRGTHRCGAPRLRARTRQALPDPPGARNSTCSSTLFVLGLMQSI